MEELCYEKSNSYHAKARRPMSYILNVASVAGLITSNGMPAYHATKHASVALSESTSYDLQAINANINMSVLWTLGSKH